MKPSVTILEKSQFIGSPCEPAFHGHFRPHSNQYMIYYAKAQFDTPKPTVAVTAATLGFQKFISIRSQGLGPIKRPLTASLYSNNRKILKERIKPKWGETPTSRSLSKLLKSGTHSKPYPRRAVLLLAPKTADGRISRYSREKHDSLTLKLHSSIYWISKWFPRFFPLV